MFLSNLSGLKNTNDISIYNSILVPNVSGASLLEGNLRYDSSTKKFQFYDSSSWQTFDTSTGNNYWEINSSTYLQPIAAYTNGIKCDKITNKTTNGGISLAAFANITRDGAWDAEAVLTLNMGTMMGAMKDKFIKLAGNPSSDKTIYLDDNSSSLQLWGASYQPNIANGAIFQLKGNTYNNLANPGSAEIYLGKSGAVFNVNDSTKTKILFNVTENATTGTISCLGPLDAPEIKTNIISEKTAGSNITLSNGIICRKALNNYWFSSIFSAAANDSGTVIFGTDTTKKASLCAHAYTLDSWTDLNLNSFSGGMGGGGGSVFLSSLDNTVNCLGGLKLRSYSILTQLSQGVMGYDFTNNWLMIYHDAAWHKIVTGDLIDKKAQDKPREKSNNNHGVENSAYTYIGKKFSEYHGLITKKLENRIDELEKKLKIISDKLEISAVKDKFEKMGDVELGNSLIFT